MLDSTIVRAHQQAASGKGAKDQALGPFRNGVTTKVHMLADALGRPLKIITAGQVGDIPQHQRCSTGRPAMPCLPTKPMTATPYAP